jgi:hypothetical protein
MLDRILGMDLRKKYPEPELPPETDAGVYYSNKDKERAYWSPLLMEARRSGAPEREIRWLEERLWQASYTGD